MRLKVVCVAAVLASVAAHAQVAPEADAPEFLAPAATISKTVDEVNLSFTVTDKKGRFISNLGPDDFRLLDNEQAPDRLTFFQQRSDLPLHVAVLIDASSSVEYRFEFETDAAAAFLKSVLRPGTDEAFVVTFNDQVKTVVAPTDKQAKLRSTLRKLKPGGNTALTDAVIYACDRLREMPENQITRRAIILISDGVDTVHRSTLEQAQQKATHSEVMIFSLTTNFSEDDTNGEGDAVLHALADSTGGALLPAHEDSQLRSALRTVQKALHNQYILAYRPPDFAPNGKYRWIRLVALKRGLHTNCRKGYFARSSSQP